MDMDLLVADQNLDADLTEAEDDHLEGLDQDSLCTCACGPGSHGPDGCRASGCPCAARCDLEDLAGALDDGELEAEEEQLAQRVAAARATAVKRRRLQDHERAAEAAEAAARWPLAQKAPRRDKPDSPHQPAAARLTGRYPTEDEISYGLSLESEALAAISAG